MGLRLLESLFSLTITLETLFLRLQVHFLFNCYLLFSNSSEIFISVFVTLNSRTAIWFSSVIFLFIDILYFSHFITFL